MQIQVRLGPHIGIQQTPLGPIEVEHAQHIIWASTDGKPELQVGYVGKQPNAPINLLRQPNGQEWPEAVKAAVRAQIAEQLGAGVRSESQPPPWQPELDDDEGFDFEDDELACEED